MLSSKYKRSSTFYRHLKKIKANGQNVIDNDVILQKDPICDIQNDRIVNEHIITPINEENQNFFDDDTINERFGSNKNDFDSDNSDDDEENTDEQFIFGFREGLQEWATSHNITHAALNALLALHHKHLNLNLPHDARTLLKTPTDVKIVPLENDGFYWHQRLYNFSDIKKSITISLNINIDWLPLCRGSSKQFWPILGNIYENVNVEPFIIGLYYGSKKPSSVDVYLKTFVEELKKMVTNGIMINGHKITVVIRCFICDTPARAFVKGKHVTYLCIHYLNTILLLLCSYKL